MGRRHKVLTLRELNIPKDKLVDKQTREIARHIMRRSQRTGHYWVLISYLSHTGLFQMLPEQRSGRGYIGKGSDYNNEDVPQLILDNGHKGFFITDSPMENPCRQPLEPIPGPMMKIPIIADNPLTFTSIPITSAALAGSDYLPEYYYSPAFYSFNNPGCNPSDFLGDKFSEVIISTKEMIEHNKKVFEHLETTGELCDNVIKHNPTILNHIQNENGGVSDEK